MLPVAFTGFTGYFIYTPRLSFALFMVTLGILLQAISSSVLNQIQETSIDRKMNRTRNRPLPSGKISGPVAFVVFLFTLVSGTFLIYQYGTSVATLAGLFTIFWYNGVYTYSKRVTAFAVVPGSLTGALPPLIGYTAAGGHPADPGILFLGFMLFMGQVPHFWLLILKYGEEYGEAGMPSLTNIFSRTQINRLSFTWIVTSVLSAVFLSWFNVIQSKSLTIILLIASAYLIWSCREMVTGPEKKQGFRRNFILLNSYFLLILMLLIADRLIPS